VFVITPDNSSVLDQTKNPTLVLTTCNPRYSAAERLIVVADRVD
jgi:sortase (surface protein transpeptidase)